MASIASAKYAARYSRSFRSAMIVSLNSLVSGISASSSLAILVVLPTVLRSLDIFRLRLLRAAGEQEHQCMSVAAVVDAIPRAGIDASLDHTLPDAFVVPEVAVVETLNNTVDSSARLHIKPDAPFLERTYPVGCPILKNNIRHW